MLDDIRWGLPLAAMALVACGGQDDATPTGPGGGGAGGTTTSSSSGGGATGGGGGAGGGGATLEVALPAAGADVLWSAAIRVATPGGTSAVIVTDEATGASCEGAAPHFECLLDLAAADPGAVTLTVAALDGEGAELSTLSHDLVKREIPTPCTGDGAALSTCILDLATMAQAAGFDGVSYLNADSTHANANTSTMTGIDHQVLDEPPATVPAGVRMGIVNESRSWNPTGGWCSMPRCHPTQRRDRAMDLYTENLFMFWPEHRDHGLRDFYMWQAPFFALSQGSSGTELDEVSKLLRALAIMSPEARDAAEQAMLLGPVMALLLVRSRVESDVVYAAAEAFPTALANLDNAESLLAMAAALRAEELPPLAQLTSHEATFPTEWGTMPQVLDAPYAIGYAPSADDGPHAGSFTIEVDLGATTDANGRTVLMFPVVLRGDDSVVVERLDDAGLTWRLSGDYPEDRMLLTNGIERTVARTTVAFFPHNGLWMGAPVMVSVGGHPAEAVAPNDNNAD